MDEADKYTAPKTPAYDKGVAGAESAFGESESGVRNDVIKKTHRTKGLWLFDNVLFNLTNLSVFVLSVYATYKSNFSQPRETPKELQNWWMKRGTEAITLFKKTGMSEEGAKNANMVLWSFIDGTVAAPFVAAFQHRRDQIGQWIDDKIGTKPKDTSIYHNQPREGWKTVAAGRLAAFSIVIPTYFLLNAKNKKNPASLSLNNILFDKAAEAIVRHDIAGIPGALKKRFPKLNVEGLVNTAVFEMFYTTLCTSILFAVSYITGKKERRKLNESHSRHLPQTGLILPEDKETAVRTSWRGKLSDSKKDASTGHAESIKAGRNSGGILEPAFGI